MMERKHPWVCPVCRGTMSIRIDGNWHCCSCDHKVETTKPEIVDEYERNIRVIRADYERKIKKLECRNVEDRNVWNKNEEPAMKVSYNGFTGELVKLEVTNNIKGTLQINGIDYSKEVFERKYNIEIYDAEKKVTHSFTNVYLKDVKFLGGSVSFE